MTKVEDSTKKVDYDKENMCSLCLCSLYDGLFDDGGLETVLEEQKKIAAQKSDPRSKVNEDIINVVQLGKCKGMHFFHKDCIDGQFKSNESLFIKCAVCNIIYGKQMGEMPPGSMNWRTQRMHLPGISCQEAIVIDYSI